MLAQPAAFFVFHSAPQPFFSLATFPVGPVFYSHSFPEKPPLPWNPPFPLKASAVFPLISPKKASSSRELDGFSAHLPEKSVSLA